MNNEPSHERASDPLRIFVYRDQKQIGPMTVEEALTKEREGALSSTDNAWTEGEQNWVQLGSLLRRFGPPPPPPTQSVPPPLPVQSAKSGSFMVTRDGKEYGPYTLGELRQYVQSGNIDAADAARLEKSSITVRVSDILSSSEAPQFAGDVSTPQLSQLWLWFMISSICAVFSLFASGEALDSFRRSFDTRRLDLGFSLLLLFIASFIAAYVLSAVMMYRGLRAVQKPSSPATPGQTVGLMFVPVFNLYWQFVATRGLADAMNQRFNSTRPVNVAFGTAMCVCTCLFALPPLIPLALIGYTVTGILFWKPIAEQTQAIGAAGHK